MMTGSWTGRRSRGLGGGAVAAGRATRGAGFGAAADHIDERLVSARASVLRDTTAAGWYGLIARSPTVNVRWIGTGRDALGVLRAQAVAGAHAQERVVSCRVVALLATPLIAPSLRLRALRDPCVSPTVHAGYERVAWLEALVTLRHAPNVLASVGTGSARIVVRVPGSAAGRPPNLLGVRRGREREGRRRRPCTAMVGMRALVGHGVDCTVGSNVVRAVSAAVSSFSQGFILFGVSYYAW